MKFSTYLVMLIAGCAWSATAQTSDTTATKAAARIADTTTAVMRVQAADTSWKHTGVAGLSATQVAFTHWAQGGENAVAWTMRLEGKSELTVPRWDWTNTYKFAYGQTKLGAKAIRKTDDQIDVGTVLSYRSGRAVNSYCAVTMKTQFSPGFSYDVNDNRIPVSAFFDPAYLVESAGLEYKPSPVIKTRLGLALREVITSAFTTYADDPKTTAIEKTKTAGGFESVTDMEMKLDDNVFFTSHLELFDPVNNFNQVIVRSDNMVTAKVSKYIVVSLNLMLVNDPQVTAFTQVKQMLTLGVNYSIFGDPPKPRKV